MKTKGWWRPGEGGEYSTRDPFHLARIHVSAGICNLSLRTLGGHHSSDANQDSERSLATAVSRTKAPSAPAARAAMSGLGVKLLKQGQ